LYPCLYPLRSQHVYSIFGRDAPHLRSAKSSVSLPFPRVYRAHIGAADSRSFERTAFVY